MNTSRSLLVPSLCLIAAVAPHAFALESRIDTATQQVKRTDLRQSLQKPTVETLPSLYKGEEQDLGPQYIVQDNKPATPSSSSRRQWIELFTDVQFGSTNNVSLVKSQHVESNLMISTAQIAIAPTPWDWNGGTLALRTGYRHQKFNYGNFTANHANLNDLDFDVSTFFVQSRYQFNEHWIASFNLDYNRLLSASHSAPDTKNYGEFYTEYAPSLSIDRFFKTSERSYLSLSAGTCWHVTHADDPNTNHNDRLDQSITAAWLYQVHDRVAVQPFYRIQASEYLRISRKDILQTAGVSVAFIIHPSASLRVFANFETRESTNSTVSDYQKFDAGTGVSLLIRF